MYTDVIREKKTQFPSPSEEKKKIILFLYAKVSQTSGLRPRYKYAKKIETDINVIFMYMWIFLTIYLLGSATHVYINNRFLAKQGISVNRLIARWKLH